MKKGFSIILSMILTVSLAACGGQTQTKDPERTVLTDIEIPLGGREYPYILYGDYYEDEIDEESSKNGCIRQFTSVSDATIVRVYLDECDDFIRR